MESLFQFSNPVLLKLDFVVNDKFDNSEEKEIKIKLKVETQVSREDDADNAFVALCLTIGEETNEFPFYIYAVEGAEFKWEKEAYDEESIDRLLQQNAPALLLSYLRPMIANVTGSSPYGAYNIPFMNFREQVNIEPAH